MVCKKSNKNNFTYLFLLNAAKVDDLFGDADDISSDDENGDEKSKIHPEKSNITGLDDDDEAEGNLVIADKVSSFTEYLNDMKDCCTI